MSTYCSAADWFSVHVSGRRGQGFPVSSFVVGDEGHHFAIDLLIGQKDTFDSTYLEKQRGYTAVSVYNVLTYRTHTSKHEFDYI